MAILKTKDYFFKARTTTVSLFSLLSYIGDWLIYSLLLVGFIIYRRNTPPRYHEFSLDDNSISHTYFNEANTMVPNALLVFLVIMLPIVQVILQFSLSSTSLIRKLWNIKCALLALLATHSLQVILVSILKINVGALRPDLISRCQPSSYAVAPIGFLSNVGICSNRNIQILNDGFKSFPSGHASTAFGSGVFSFFLFVTKLKVSLKTSSAWKIVVSIFPLLIATYITATRYSDNRHFSLDLFAGTFIGVLSAVVAYHMYFPWFLSVINVGEAYPPRIAGSGINAKYWKLSPEDTKYQYDEDAVSINEVVDLNADIEQGFDPKTSTASLRLQSLSQSAVSLRNRVVDAVTPSP